MNAGIMPNSPLSALKTDEWNNMVDVNIKGVLNGIAAVLPSFTSQKSGHIITTSSVAGLKLTQVVQFIEQRSGLFET
ncbi:SDR family NAD(P)-dependent oxidoreductase [Cytobacillus firmus]|nr:SDR family NAD(P)-dependent oxidoreductase [Cytobacillus firmus]